MGSLVGPAVPGAGVTPGVNSSIGKDKMGAGFRCIGCVGLVHLYIAI